jgi:site-specific recombinase XerD
MSQSIVSPSADLLPAPLFAPSPAAAQRFIEFFTAQINNEHTRKAYLNATRRFTAWCEAHGLQALGEVRPFHVAAFVKDLQGSFSPPTVKQHLAALRMLFDWLVTGHVLDVNPAHAVRGPKYVVKKGKTPVLTAEEARSLLRSIDTPADGPTAEEDPPTVQELRDRALIGVMVYTFARVGAVIRMQVKDYFTQGRRAAGCGCTRRAARSMRCPATTHWRNCSTSTSPRPASPTTRTARCSAPQAARPARHSRSGSRTYIA